MKTITMDVAMNVATVKILLQGGEYNPGTGRKMTEEDEYGSQRSQIEKALGHNNGCVYGFKYLNGGDTGMYGDTIVRFNVPADKVTATLGDSWSYQGIHDAELTVEVTQMVRDGASEEEIMFWINSITPILEAEGYFSEYDSVWNLIPYLEMQYGGSLDKSMIGGIYLPVYPCDGHYTGLDADDKAYFCLIREIRHMYPCDYITIWSGYNGMSKRGYLRWYHVIQETIKSYGLTDDPIVEEESIMEDFDFSIFDDEDEAPSIDEIVELLEDAE